MRTRWALPLLVLLPLTAHAVDLISHRVLNVEEAGSKVSFDVEVDPVGDRLPNEEELAALSDNLAGERSETSKFVLFYLPDMKPGAGAFATANHNPNMEVNIMPFALIAYPQYKEFLPAELQEFVD